MATRRLTRSQQLQQTILYPLDWLEERSGLVGGVRYFLFRNVPGDINWFQTLGSATLTAFLVQALTGSILAMYYKPDANSAYDSIPFTCSPGKASVHLWMTAVAPAPSTWETENGWPMNRCPWRME